MCPMDWIWYLVLTCVLVVGLGVNVVGLPGLWLMIGGTGVYGWVTGWQYVGLWTIVTLVVLGIAAEVVEFLAGGAGAKKEGGSRRAWWGALLGGMIGAIFLTVPIPGIGTIIGACLGAFIGAVVMEFTKHGEPGLSWRVGIGAAKGKFWGIVSKLAFGIVILIVAMVMALPLAGRRTTPTTMPTSGPVL